MRVQKNVPKLRFGEFVGGWQKEPLSQKMTIFRGASPRPKGDPRYYGGKIPRLMIKDATRDGKYTTPCIDSLTEEGAKKSRYLSAGSVVLSCSGTRVAIPTILDVDACVHDGWLAFKNYKAIEPEFLYYLFVKLHERMQGSATTGGVFNNLTTEIMNNLVMGFPSISEQQKIASFLSKVDKKIRLLTEKKDKLIEYKKSVMQQLFNGRFEKNSEGDKTTFISPILRFKADDGSDFPDWEDSQIGSYTEQLNGYAFKSDEIGEIHEGYQLMRGINITEGRIRHSVEMDRYYSGDISKITKYLIKEDDLVIGMDGSKVGKNVSLITKRDSNSLLVQRVARLRSKPRTSIQYIYQNIIAEKFRRYVDVVNTSSGIPHISKKQIEDYRIGFPCFEEQVKIANFLSSIDQKISLANSELEKFKQWKKGLLQQMFV